MLYTCRNALSKCLTQGDLETTILANIKQEVLMIIMRKLLTARNLVAPVAAVVATVTQLVSVDTESSRTAVLVRVANCQQ